MEVRTAEKLRCWVATSDWERRCGGFALFERSSMSFFMRHRSLNVLHIAYVMHELLLQIAHQRQTQAYRRGTFVNDILI